VSKAKVALDNAWVSATQISIPKKIMRCPEENSVKKNVFTQKYDEIRSFDGIGRLQNFVSRNYAKLFEISRN
jgi:hypothetical protein